MTKNTIKNMIFSIPNSLKVLFLVMFFSLSIFKERVLALLLIPVDALFLFILIFKSGEIHFLVTIIFCFAIACALRYFLPESSKHLAKCWLVISFLCCLSYGHMYYLNENLFMPIPYHFDIPFLLCCVPGVLGLWMGRVIKCDGELC